jgi:lipopolysaccharide transport system permease protein
MIKIFTQHRYLLWQFTKRQIEQRHRGSALGIIWSVLLPLLMMAIYTVVFGLIFKGRYGILPNETPKDYALGIFLSITIFQTISEVISSSAGAVIAQPNLVKKVVFPLEILPLANLGAALYQFCISLILVLVGVVILGDGLSLHSLLFFVAFLPLIPIALGTSLLLSALGVFLRDIQHAVGPISMVLMYASALFFPVQKIKDHPAIWAYLKFNPLIHVIEQARAVLLWHQPLQWHGLAYSFVFGLALLAIGLVTFKKLKPAFADVI